MSTASAELFAAAQAGEPAALERLLREVQPDIRRYARRQCHRTSVLEDVVQEALIVVYRRVGTVRDPAAFVGWLARVVGRLCMLPALVLLRAVEDSDTAPELQELTVRSMDDLRIDLARALESLPAMYREALLLRDMEQLTIGEIATRLALTHEAVKSRIHRARLMVREYLGSPHE